MKISIFGLGYVGCVGMGCLAKNGHTVVGVDVSELKVDLINAGKPTIIENEIAEILEEQHALNRVSATTDFKKAVLDTEVSFICVGTPSMPTGHLNLSYIHQTAEQIGSAIKEKNTYHVVVIRSTVSPGTNKKLGEIIEQVSGKKRGVDFGVISNPEFLREGSAVSDYFNPPMTVVGGDDQKALAIMREIYEKINAPLVETDIEVAEIIKYVNNSYHALKVSYANEVGNICKTLGIDSHKVMSLFCMDKHLNISNAYFMPGFAYGGSCLPKDTKGLLTLGHDKYIETPIIQAIENSNSYHKKHAIELIESLDKRKIGFLGLSFKAGTDDLRYSPSVELVEYLFGKGYDIKIWDKNVHLSKLIGANKSYIQKHIPHISELISEDFNQVIAESEVIIVTQKVEGIENIIRSNKDKIFIDVIRVIDSKSADNYIGICW